MDKSEKMAEVEIKQERAVAGRFVAWLAGAVALLAVAFIVLIACGTWMIQHQPTCDDVTTETPVQDEHAMTKNVEAKHNNTMTHERITVYPESQIEFIVNRNAETGHVETVMTVEYAKKTTTYYRAENNQCYLLRGFDFGNFDGALDKLESNPEDAQEMRLNVEVGGRVENATEIPVQMAAFCSTQNTNYLTEMKDDQEGRSKRATLYLCAVYCDWFYLFYNGNWYYVYVCIYYFSYESDCSSIDYIYYYVF